MSDSLAGIRHVVFDFGGTLADLRFPLTMFRRFSPTTTVGSGDVRQPGRLRRWVRTLVYPVAARLFRPFDGLHRVLAELSARGYRLHVLSNNSSILPLQLRVLGIDDVFDTVSWSEEMGVEKPDRRIFDLALERIGAEAGEVLYVGDSFAADVVGAKAAGITPVHADYMSRRTSGPGLRIDRLTELPELLPEVAPPAGS